MRKRFTFMFHHDYRLYKMNSRVIFHLGGFVWIQCNDKSKYYAQETVMVGCMHTVLMLFIKIRYEHE